MVAILKPHLPDSIDGKPLVTTVGSLLVPYQFPYHRLPLWSQSPFWNIASWFLRPEIVLLTITFYLLSKPLLVMLRTFLRLHHSPQPRWFRLFLALHNAGLAIFSAVCAYHTWIIAWRHYNSYGFVAVYCDLDGTFWSESNFGAWAYIFYLSKYYEFVDTWILILKGKDASFLQVYHHTGIAFIMWCAVASQSSWLLFVALLNSVIHTLMYTYFCIKTISPKTEIRAAKYLTMAQIGQFVTGIVCTFPIFFLGSTCATSSSRFALACLHLYGIGLIGLFVTFAQKKYKKDV
jgi:GNS1/SUR4 family